MKAGEHKPKPPASYRWRGRLIEVEREGEAKGQIARIHPEGTAHYGLAKLPKKLRGEVPN